MSKEALLKKKTYTFTAIIRKEPDHGGAYVEIPFSVKEAFGKSRVLVHASFDAEPYDGQLVKMGTEGHILGVRKDIQAKLCKYPGDAVQVTVEERAPKEKTVTSIDAYIEGLPPQRQEVLRRVRQVVKEAAPEAKERISWGMPTYWQGENLLHFANAKEHLGLYPTPEALDAFSEELAPYKRSKGGVRFLYQEPIPYALIGAIAAWRVGRVRAKKEKAKKE